MATLTIPLLTTEQKNELKALMDDYRTAQTSSYFFKYNAKVRRESYAYPNNFPSNDTINGCMDNGKYLLNGGVFAQMIWMGRKVSDFTSHMTTPITTINKAFDWGYYFDFLSAQNAYMVRRSDNTIYNENTYDDGSSTRKFLGYDSTSCMASELYHKGFEIPYSQADIGDLVFYRTKSLTDGTSDNLEAASFRNINGVAIIYNINSDGSYTVLECSSAYTTEPKYLQRACNSSIANLKLYNCVRGAFLDYRVAMCARHPIAYNKATNVPTLFSTYRRK
jgi:hypothetical protein